MQAPNDNNLGRIMFKCQLARISMPGIQALHRLFVQLTLLGLKLEGGMAEQSLRV
jgi:hypothetical protein